MKAASNAELARKLEALENKYDRQFKVVFDAIRQLMSPPETKRREIGSGAVWWGETLGEPLVWRITRSSASEDARPTNCWSKLTHDPTVGWFVKVAADAVSSRE